MMASSAEMKTEYSTNIDMDDFEDKLNDDNTSVPESLYERSTIDYWFGRKYFESAIAQQVFENAAQNTTFATIDSQFQKTTRSFSHAAALASFRQELSASSKFRHIPTGADGYSTFITCIGTVIRTGTTQERHALLAAIRRHSEVRSVLPNNIPGPNLAFHPLSKQTSPPNGRNSPPGGNDAFKDEVYTAWLEERAVREGVKHEYVTERSPDYPDEFRALLFYRDFTFEGSGKTKKQAKHKASKEACTVLRAQHEGA